MPRLKGTPRTRQSPLTLAAFQPWGSSQDRRRAGSNVGLLPHPVSGEPSLGFTTYGKVKLGNLRARPQLAVTFRNGWQWATVEGRAQLVGPDDPRPWLVDGERLRLLLREVFTAAGGTHDDWDEYDRVMAQEQRAVVLITPTRIYSNG